MLRRSPQSTPERKHSPEIPGGIKPPSPRTDREGFRRSGISCWHRWTIGLAFFIASLTLQHFLLAHKHATEDPGSLRNLALHNNYSVSTPLPSSSMIPVETTATNTRGPLSGHKRIHPIQFQYDFKTNTGHHIRLFQNELAAEPSTEIYRASRGDDDDVEDQKDAVCEAINPNYRQLYQNCGILHEIDPIDGTFINCGGARCAFYLPDKTATSQRVVLKTQKYKKDWKPRRWEKARKDGLIMELATHSQFVANVYGTCGTSQLLEYAPRGALHDHIKLSRLAMQDTMKPVDKLKILIHIASAITDLHDPKVAAVHGDICCHQFLWMDGFYRLNDFHMSSFIFLNKTSHQTCPGRNSVAQHEYLWRAPEESETDFKTVKLDLEKVDVWQMAQTMFYVYTKQWLYEGMPEKQAYQLFHNRTLSSFPSHLNTANSANAAMQAAIQWCWNFQAEKRPTAQQVRDYLLQQLSTIVGRPIGPRDHKELAVAVPPLPKNHRYTDSSMDGANPKKGKEKKHIRYTED
ncbi:Inherit from COG: Guanylate Cyclase [Seminavis robusta]|uniref:Inherit from COG: Guanylate Cyclase n=1 Tax=Seminavis robusta TaxID=568900 RepID=A0A9N8E4V9_9STRA|nr:Inherit from COG: Guanylate Cyclase [Seminavis robusta]|eukprot:Sro671_g184830.1 Inherit from COG: Guanylate Cyclase (519) ;mRNA; f:13089-14844